MTKPVPINSLNAIEAIAFIVILSEKLTKEENQSLLSLEHSLKSDLPSFTQNTNIDVKLDGQTLVQQKFEASGVTLRHLDKNNKPTWALAVKENQIIVNCSSYDGWAKSWPKAKKFIQSSFDCIGGIKGRDISSLSIQCIDKFTQKNNEKTYSQLDVFKEDTEFLTKHSSSVGSLWHVHQGWFEKKSDGDKILNILNIGTTEQDINLITAIDHIAQYRFKNIQSLQDFKSLEDNFNDLHSNNKKLIKSLLNKKQSEAVGL